jgi:hypothetical protein
VMPDLHLTIEEMVAEGDKVVCGHSWRWTEAGSGKKMRFHGFVLWRFERDKIAERWATVTPPAQGTACTHGQDRRSPEKPAAAHLCGVRK